jgi:hypothetical protein
MCSVYKCYNSFGSCEEKEQYLAHQTNQINLRIQQLQQVQEENNHNNVNYYNSGHIPNVVDLSCSDDNYSSAAAEELANPCNSSSSKFHCAHCGSSNIVQWSTDPSKSARSRYAMINGRKQKVCNRCGVYYSRRKTLPPKILSIAETRENNNSQDNNNLTSPNSSAPCTGLASFQPLPLPPSSQRFTSVDSTPSNASNNNSTAPSELDNDLDSFIELVKQATNSRNAMLCLMQCGCLRNYILNSTTNFQLTTSPLPAQSLPNFVSFPILSNAPNNQQLQHIHGESKNSAAAKTTQRKRKSTSCNPIDTSSRTVMPSVIGGEIALLKLHSKQSAASSNLFVGDSSAFNHFNPAATKRGCSATTGLPHYEQLPVNPNERSCAGSPLQISAASCTANTATLSLPSPLPRLSTYSFY